MVVGREWLRSDVLGDHDFARLWVGITVSQFGSQVSTLAIPLIGVLTFGASPFQMGLLTAAGQAPFLFLSLPAGVIVDRTQRKPLLVATDAIAGILLLSIPTAAVFDMLSFAHLLVVAFGVGATVTFGEVAQYAYVPSLVGRDRLVMANSRIQASHSAAESAGPGLGGVLVQILSAPFAIVINAATFLISAWLTSKITQTEPHVQWMEAKERSLLQQVGAGVRFLFEHPLLRVVILVSIASQLFAGGFMALLVLYLVNSLGLSPITIGLLFVIGGLSAIPGATLADRVARSVGVGKAIISGWVVETLARLIIPLAAGPFVVVVALLGVAQAANGATGTIANIHQWTLRQVVTPERLQGRVTAGHRFLVYGTWSIGALLGGALGSAVGVRQALLVCAVADVLTRLPALRSRLWDLKEQPASTPE